MQYYFQGCPSWNWYYPYHYAPFASDFGEVEGKVDNEFETNTAPVRPLEQLMSVFPPGSSHYLPESWAKLMTDPASPMLSAYPTDFVTDLNGKKQAWQGVICKGSPATRFVVGMALFFVAMPASFTNSVHPAFQVLLSCRFWIRKSCLRS